ncbi:MAG TPA: hypothetical protein VKW78_11485 [Terriglobales bacterium]|nr:hypothetical protein [Terriglobales bacterium]
MVHAGIPKLLDKLEKIYGVQTPAFPTDPYEFIVWWQCGYPASDAACAKGWQQLKAQVGIEAGDLLKASPKILSGALRAGGMVPEIRAERLKEIARIVQDEYGGDLRAGLAGPISKTRKTLKRFPGIADPGADRILLFARIAPVAAIPSNCPHVLSRLLQGKDAYSYNTDYREAQEAISAAVPEKFEARSRAYLLIKQHGQQTCKRTNPQCGSCPISTDCAFYALSPQSKR